MSGIYASDLDKTPLIQKIEKKIERKFSARRASSRKNIHI